MYFKCAWQMNIIATVIACIAMMLGNTRTMGAPGQPSSALGPDDVLILVNSNSPTSRYVAKMYRQYYPNIEDWQVLELAGLTDCNGSAALPEDEIIDRNAYETYIENPVIQYLLDDPNRINRIKVLITTAGMPYRIKDTDPAFANAVFAAGSDPLTVGNNEAAINAASVESELSCLWYSDWGLSPFEIENRMVNPYQAYRSSPIKLFGDPRHLTDIWSWELSGTLATGVQAPKIEGIAVLFGVEQRQFGPRDILLVSRLDGPKAQGESAVFVIRKMLERASRASDPTRGIYPLQSAVVIDAIPVSSGLLDNNRVYNLSACTPIVNPQCNPDDFLDYWVYDPNSPQPPGASGIQPRSDFSNAYTALTGQAGTADTLNVSESPSALGLVTLYDTRPNTRTDQSELDQLVVDSVRGGEQGLLALASYGRNGDEGNPPSYLLDGGQNGAPLFQPVNGAVFTSIESFNAVTMFADVATQTVAQGKIVDFISIGGTGAIGFAFEPQSDAAIDTEFFLHSLTADQDGDRRADLTFIESAYNGICYLSWAEVVVGDPLMRYAYNDKADPNAKDLKAWNPLEGDANRDDKVDLYDFWLVKNHLGGRLDSLDSLATATYNDLCDMNKDGIVDYLDLWTTKTKISQR